MIISLDTECTGLDLAHGARPYLVTTCDGDDRVRFWEWDVDPLTREPQIPDEEWGDRQEIEEIIDAAELIYLHNSDYDVRALATIGITLPWGKVRDTLVAGHLLASNHRHGLDAMCLEYLKEDISVYENNIERVTKACRLIVKRNYPTWKLAREGMPGGPSLKDSSKKDEDKTWKADMWLPRALAKQMDLPKPVRGCKHRWVNDLCTHCTGHFWWVACSEYANTDSLCTVYLGQEVERLIQESGYWPHYLNRLTLPRIACEMENNGITVIGEYTDSTIAEYSRYVSEAQSELHDIAAQYGHDLELAEGAALNDNMREFFYGSVRRKCPRCKLQKVVKHWNAERPEEYELCPKCAKGTKKKSGITSHMTLETRANLALPVIGNKKTGNASLDKDAIREYLITLEGDAHDFVRILADKRKHDTDLTYMRAYQRFWLACESSGYYRIHPSLNPFGTDHLRWASSNPNCQNIGKQEDECDECKGKDKSCLWCGGSGKTRTSVRYCFGPAPGREWWSMDYQNIELRIPAYESGEPKMVEVFERAGEPPYWGSYHNLIASIVYPDEYYANDLHLTENGFKKKYKSTLYQWMKNFNFAKQYGCGCRKGDDTARKRGAFDMVDSGLPRLAECQAYHLAHAERYSYVTTLPSRAIDPEKGYPILASRTDEDRVLSTTPFNYHVSGTACEAKNMGLLRCSAQLAEWRKEGFDAYITLEIHDEILFDFPRGKDQYENLARAMVLKGLMEQSGEDLIPRIPIPVSVEWHPVTWAEGIAV